MTPLTRLLKQEETRPATCALITRAWERHGSVKGVAKALGLSMMTARRALDSAGVQRYPDYPGVETEVPDQLMTWAEAAALLGRTEGSIRTWPSRYGLKIDGTGMVNPRRLLDARYGVRR
jgi:hypothetical protein